MMKNRFPILIAATILLFLACSTDTSRYSQKLEKELTGLGKLPLTQGEKDAILSMITDSANLSFPVYSIQGERLSQAQIREKAMNVTVDGFGESAKNLKAVVFRDITKAELEEIFTRIRGMDQREKQVMGALTGKPAPVFSAKDVEGNLVDMAALKGTVVVLNFWFIHCKACVQEMPDLNQVKQDFKDKSVAFIGLTFDKEEDTRAFLQHTKFDYNIIAAARNIFDLYGVEPCPTSIVIDKTGQVVFAKSGYFPKDTSLTEAIKKALE